LVSMGAESAVTVTQPVTTVNAIPVQGAEGAPPITQTSTTTQTVVNTLRIDTEDSTPLLRGLQVLVDTRLNSVTLVGARNLVDVASAQLVQLDLRRRQVAVNVRVVDVNLANTQNFGTSFSFGIDQTRAISTGGVGVINFGSTTPGTAPVVSPPGVGAVPVAGGFLQPFQFARQFLLQLQANISSGNAKILTDPTLVVQEGQTATVNLTQEVIGNITTTTTATANASTITSTAEIKEAGLILGVNVERIDDNGFVSLSVAPRITSIGSFANLATQQIALLSERSLSSGTVRLRDGQTLILSGIIQDTDRADVSKVPLLGDIPLLGALFRRTTKTNARNEVIVLLTPQILDDSDRSTFGYNYSPGADARQILERGTTRNPERQ
jgi:type IV pilus assembly protein PilQ